MALERRNTTLIILLGKNEKRKIGNYNYFCSLLPIIFISPHKTADSTFSPLRIFYNFYPPYHNKEHTKDFYPAEKPKIFVVLQMTIRQSPVWCCQYFSVLTGNSKKPFLSFILR